MTFRFHHSHDQPWRLNVPPKVLMQHLGKGLVVPDDGWNAREFARQGGQLIAASRRIAVVVQRRAFPYLAGKVKAMIRRQVEKVIHRVAASIPKSVSGQKDPFVDITVRANEELWVRAINEVFQEAGIEAIAELTPPIQSVMGQGYSRTNMLLGQTDRSEAAVNIVRKANEIAGRITKIDETTRDLFRRIINRGVADGIPPIELAGKLRADIDGLTGYRSNMIARTELSNAWTEGSASSFMESDVVTHVSVIGCLFREPKSPQYRGESTCNIEDVPIGELTALMDVGWHPNHTGTLIPTGFKD